MCQAGDCKGHRQVLRGTPGYVTDGPGNYSVNGNCEWLIKGMVTEIRCCLGQGKFELLKTNLSCYHTCNELWTFSRGDVCEKANF